MPGSNNISVLIVDDQLISRLGLQIIIEKESNLTIVGEAENGALAVEKSQELKPSVVVMDVGMPVMDGIEATKQIKAIDPGIFVLILTSHDRDEDIFAALAAGADGYCLKDANADVLISAIRAVGNGATWLDSVIAKRVLRSSSSEKPTASVEAKKKDKFALSIREIEVLELLVEGLTNQQMAERLVLSSETVKTHMRHIMEKLAVSDRTQAAVKALREGLCAER